MGGLSLTIGIPPRDFKKCDPRNLDITKQGHCPSRERERGRRRNAGSRDDKERLVLLRAPVSCVRNSVAIRARD